MSSLKSFFCVLWIDSSLETYMHTTPKNFNLTEDKIKLRNSNAHNSKKFQFKGTQNHSTLHGQETAESWNGNRSCNMHLKRTKWTAEIINSSREYEFLRSTSYYTWLSIACLQFKITNVIWLTSKLTSKKLETENKNRITAII